MMIIAHLYNKGGTCKKKRCLQTMISIKTIADVLRNV